jgi:hypothetical protein
MPEEWAECKMPGCHASCGSSEEFCAVHRETMRTGEPMDIAWQLLKAWPHADIPDLDDDHWLTPEKKEPPPTNYSHLPLQHSARRRHRGQAARTGGIEGLEGTMPPEFWMRPPGKKEMRPELESVSREEALAGEGAEMPDPHELEPPEGEPPERGLESAWREITGSGGTVAEELEEHLRPAEEKEQQAQEEKSQLNEMARQMGEKAENYFTEGAERSENTLANMTTDELRDVYRPLAQQHSSMSDEEQEADPDFMEELEEVRQALRSAEWKEGQNEPPTTESTTARPTRGGRRGNVRVQPRRGTPRRYTRGE